MTGTFVATPSRALTIEHEPVGRALTQFKPEEVRGNLSKIDLLASYGAKLRDDSKLYELAVAKLETIVDIMDWWSQNVYPNGYNPASHGGSAQPGGAKYSQPEAMEALGYSPKTDSVLVRWRKLNTLAKLDTDAAVAQIVDGWKMRAGMLAPPDPKPRKETDQDLAVEMVFRALTKIEQDQVVEIVLRAYTKILDPDRCNKVKEGILKFEKSFKDPFKDAKEW